MQCTLKWLHSKTIKNTKGILFNNLEIPRFKEVRKEIDDAKKWIFKMSETLYQHATVKMREIIDINSKNA